MNSKGRQRLLFSWAFVRGTHRETEHKGESPEGVRVHPPTASCSVCLGPFPILLAAAALFSSVLFFFWFCFSAAMNVAGECVWGGGG